MPFVHAVLYGMFFMYLCKQSSRLKDDCWFTLHNCITMHGTKNVKLITLVVAVRIFRT